MRIFDSAVSVSGNTISDNSARKGGNMAILCGEPVIQGNIIEDNLASRYGGGIFVDSLSYGTRPAAPRITENAIRDNTATLFGGGIIILSDALVKDRNGNPWTRANYPPYS